MVVCILCCATIDELGGAGHVRASWLRWHKRKRQPAADLASSAELFHAVSNMPEQEQHIVKQLLERMIIQYDAER